MEYVEGVKNLFCRNGVYYARVKIGGQDIKRSLGTRDQKTALKKLKALLRAIDKVVEEKEQEQGLVFTEGGLSSRSTYKEVAEWFCDTLVDTIVKPSSAKRYRSSIRTSLGFFGNWKIAGIEDEDFLDFIEWRRDKFDVTNTTLQRDFTAIGHLFRAARQRKIISRNPVLEFDRYYIKGQIEITPLPTPSEIREFARRCPSYPLKKLVEFLPLTGMRLTEASTLEWSQVDFDRKEITLLKTKTNNPRVLRFETPVDQGGTVEKLLHRLREKSLSRFVFSTKKDSDLKNLSSRLRLIRLGREGQEPLGFRTHDLRHYMAVSWLRNGGDIYELSKYLGHRSVKTTEIYLRWLAV